MLILKRQMFVAFVWNEDQRSVDPSDLRNP